MSIHLDGTSGGPETMDTAWEATGQRARNALTRSPPPGRAGGCTSHDTMHIYLYTYARREEFLARGAKFRAEGRPMAMPSDSEAISDGRSSFFFKIFFKISGLQSS